MALRRTSQSGAVLVFMALLLPVLLLMMAWSLSVTEGASRRSELVRSADAAASAGASVLCSTRNCYNLVLIRALEALRTMPVKGRVSARHFVQGIDGALAELRAQDIMKNYIGPPSGNPEWLIDGVRIQVQRGRWWKNGAPEAVDRRFLFPPLRPDYQQDYRGEPQFEAFDRFDDIVWQREVPGTPRFIVANAVRVKLTHEKFRSWFSYMTVPQDIEADTIAARLERTRENLTFCGAPFAIPVCALLNQDGEFDPKYTCQFDRYFVARSEHPAVSDPAGRNPRFWTGSENLPGAIWGPLTETYCDQSKPWYSQQRCQCFDHAGEEWTKGVVPCAQQFGQGAMQCHFNGWPFFNQVSDHYGVVGLSYGSGPLVNENAVSEAQMLELAQKPDIYLSKLASGANNPCLERDASAPGGYRKAYGAIEYTIGKPFFVRDGGLWEPYFDDMVWNKICGSNYSVPDCDSRCLNRYYPLQWDPKNPEWQPGGFTDLGWHWFTGLIDDRWGYPAGAAKGVIDQLVAAHYIEPYVRIPPGACAALRPPQATAPCGSHRAWWDNRCHKFYRMWQVPTREHGGDPCAGLGLNCPLDKLLSIHPLGQDTPPGFPNSDGMLAANQLGGLPYWAAPELTLPTSPLDCLSKRYWSDLTLSEQFAAGYYGPEYRGPLMNPFFGSDPLPYPLPQMGWIPGWSGSGERWTHPDPYPNPIAFAFFGAAQGFDPAQRWSGSFRFTPSVHPYGCEDTLPYMPCAAPTGEWYSPYQSPTNTRVWNISIPVIADPNGQSCAGINGSLSDPPVSPIMTIVGFIRTSFIDDDIGFPSPPPPGYKWMNGTQYWQADSGWHGNGFAGFYADTGAWKYELAKSYVELHSLFPFQYAYWQDFGSTTASRGKMSWEEPACIEYPTPPWWSSNP